MYYSLQGQLIVQINITNFQVNHKPEFSGTAESHPVQDKDENVKKQKGKGVFMKRTDIEQMNNEIVTIEQLTEIELFPEVTGLECLGTSSTHPDCQWYSVEFGDETSIDVFVKKSDFQREE